ncbi:MAG: rubrerythrin family protein [Clostridia bacterium]|nr:rubrerythrin family protein [Clostridia bacterium]
MSVSFQESKTKENLMRAFAGESQARNRYTFAASQAKKENLDAVAEAFLFTAGQEKEHAEVFYNFLKEVAGTTIEVDGAYPVDVFENTVALLRAAQHNEYEEYDDAYPKFAEVAKEEGFTQIANAFTKIAEIEKSHGDRFAMLAELLESNQLYKAETNKQWMCLNCGYIFDGTTVPEKCPVCQHAKGYFIPVELAPYAKQ